MKLEKLNRSNETKTVEIKFYADGTYLIYVDGNLQWHGETWEEIVETIEYAKENEYLDDFDDYCFPNGTNVMSLLY